MLLHRRGSFFLVWHASLVAAAGIHPSGVASVLAAGVDDVVALLGIVARSALGGLRPSWVMSREGTTLTFLSACQKSRASRNWRNCISPIPEVASSLRDVSSSPQPPLPTSGMWNKPNTTRWHPKAELQFIFKGVSVRGHCIIDALNLLHSNTPALGNKDIEFSLGFLPLEKKCDCAPTRNVNIVSSERPQQGMRSLSTTTHTPGNSTVCSIRFTLTAVSTFQVNGVDGALQVHQLAVAV